MSDKYENDRVAEMRYYLRKGFTVRVTVAQSFRELFGLTSARSSLLSGLALRDTHWQGLSLHAQQSGGFLTHDNGCMDYRAPRYWITYWYA